MDKLHNHLSKRESSDIPTKFGRNLWNAINLLTSEMKLLNDADENFYTSISVLISLISRASELFESSDVEQKRKLLSFLFSNLQINGSKLEYAFKKPFDLIAKLPNCTEWWAVLGSNQRPLRCQGEALYIYYLLFAIISIYKTVGY